MNIEEHVMDMAKESVGNWKKFTTFAWWSAPEDKQNWAHFVLSHRDTEDLVLKVNEEVIREQLEPYSKGAYDEADVSFERHSHWAVGYLNMLCIRVYDREGKITEAFSKFAKLQIRIDNYPCLDDDRLSELEYEKALEDIRYYGGSLIGKRAKEGWKGEVYRWIDNSEFGCINLETVCKAILALKINCRQSEMLDGVYGSDKETILKLIDSKKNFKRLIKVMG